MNIVNRLTENDFRELCEVLCPYCRAKLPDHISTRMGADKMERRLIHTIPGTENTYECVASPLRAARTVAPYRMPPE